MDELADYKRKNNKLKNAQDCPEGILEIMESDYPTRYLLLLDDRTKISSLFSREEWIDILTKSRNSYSSHIQRMNLTKKYSAHGS